jgi:tetratricopeptide (TPR) repeat protein
MKFYFSVLVYLTIFVKLHGQVTSRGVVIKSSQVDNKLNGTAYALVVGISTYKDPSIPQLQYADVDALAFHEFLKTNGVQEDNIHLLLNENATNAAFWTILNYISEKATKGDQVYIYFSGHGDVETKTIVKDAYLLPYDSPSSVYPMGAIGMVYLKSWLATFSSNGIQTIFIADACKSGNLIGGREGMEAAANMLKDKWQDEIKIVSCQPGELSLEGANWGGGRGLFSYELINGLSGQADKNQDKFISLRELYLYLMEVVPEKAGKHPQNPILTGNLEHIISKKNESLYAFNQHLKMNESDEYLSMNTGNENTKGLSKTVKNDLQKNDSISNKNEISLSFDVNSDPLLNIRSIPSTADTAIISLYSKFLNEINNNKIVAYNPPNAYDSYQRIMKLTEENIGIKENATLVFSNKLMSDIKILIEWLLSDKEPDFDLVPISFEATILRKLLGDQKLRDIGKFSQVLFAESCRTVLINQEHDLHMPREIAMAKLDTALQFDRSAVYVNFLKGFLFNENSQRDLAIIEYKKALYGNPNFHAAKIMLTKEFFASKDYDSVLTYANMGTPTLPSDVLCWISYKKLNKNEPEAVYYARVLNQCYSPLDAELTFWNNLNVADLLSDIKEHTAAIPFYEKSIPALQRFMGDSLFRKIKGRTLQESDGEIDFMEEYSSLYYNLACCYATTGNISKALEAIETSLEGGWTDFEWMKKDEDLKALHSNKKFFKMIRQKEKAYKKLNKN